MTISKKVPFFTNSEYGQANIVLAAAYALKHIASEIEIHIASFSGLKAAVLATSECALRSAPAFALPLIFYKIKGVSRHKAVDRPGVGHLKAGDRPPGLINSARSITTITAIMQPYEVDEFGTNYCEAERTIHMVKPDVAAVDPPFTPDLTLCHHIGISWIVFAPTDIKNFAVPDQPTLAKLTLILYTFVSMSAISAVMSICKPNVFKSLCCALTLAPYLINGLSTSNILSGNKFYCLWEHMS